MKAKSLLYDLAVDLNDAAPGHEFTTWSARQLLTYVEEGLQVACALRPDLFLHTVVIPVTPMSTEQTACQCTRIYRVIGQSDENGKVIRELRRMRSAEEARWFGPMCGRISDKLTEYSIDDTSNKIWLYPQVPPNKKLYLLIECAVAPEGIDDSFEVPVQLLPIVKQWVLYRAKLVDGENNPLIVQVATMHEQSFYRLLSENQFGEEADK